MSSGSPKNTRKSRGKARNVPPHRKVNAPRKFTSCRACGRDIFAMQRRATINGDRFCWPCVEPYSWRIP